jgi:hypothetical protein
MANYFLREKGRGYWGFAFLALPEGLTCVFAEQIEGIFI